MCLKIEWDLSKNNCMQDSRWRVPSDNVSFVYAGEWHESRTINSILSLVDSEEEKRGAVAQDQWLYKDKETCQLSLMSVFNSSQFQMSPVVLASKTHTESAPLSHLATGSVLLLQAGAVCECVESLQSMINYACVCKHKNKCVSLYTPLVSYLH